MHKFIYALASSALLLCASLAQASVYKLDFSASGFGTGIFSGTAAPQDPVTGSITFTTTTFGAPIRSIDAIDLMIAGHTYTPGEIGSGLFGNGYFIGAKANNSAGVVSAGTDDFYIIVSSNLRSFNYARAGVFDSYVTSNVTGNYALQAAAVPEPGSVALLIAGFAGLGLMRRRAR